MTFSYVTSNWLTFLSPPPQHGVRPLPQPQCGQPAPPGHGDGRGDHGAAPHRLPRTAQSHRSWRRISISSSAIRSVPPSHRSHCAGHHDDGGNDRHRQQQRLSPALLSHAFHRVLHLLVQSELGQWCGRVWEIVWWGMGLVVGVCCLVGSFCIYLFI